jgi:dUTP pyrophosphatase
MNEIFKEQVPYSNFGPRVPHLIQKCYGGIEDMLKAKGLPPNYYDNLKPLGGPDARQSIDYHKDCVMLENQDYAEIKSQNSWYIEPIKSYPSIDIIEVKVKKLHPNAQLPSRKRDDDAGFDLYALEDYELKTGVPVKVKTGIAVEIPNGYVGEIWDRSSMGSKGIKVLGGVIDSSYRGELMVVLINLEMVHDIARGPGYTVKKVSKGDKIAQLLTKRVPHVTMTEVAELSSSDRGEAGFGSSGA